MTGKSFSVWLNNEYIPNNPEKVWMKEVYSKAVKKSIEDGCTAFTRFFKHCKFRLIRPHIPLRTDQPFRM